MPARAKSAKLPSTSSGMLTRSGKKRRRLNRQEPVAGSEREQKPAGTKSVKLPSTSSGMLTRSGKKRRRLNRQEPVAGSEREQKPAGTKSVKLPSTSSGMLTRSGKKRRRLNRQEPVAGSEREQKPAGTKSVKLPSTSSGMLTRSGKKRRRLNRQRPSMLDVPALLLTTLEELTGEQLKTFQSKLTSVQLPGFPPIPESQLENADRQDTVDQMVKRYGPVGAVKITLMILKRMNQHDLAKKLQRDHRGSPLFLEHHHMSSPEEFTPEIHDQDNRGEYQFQCPSAGLFQCSITGLVFRMEGEGEVLYRTVPWNRRLLAQSGKRPAGPLFKFTCLNGSVCQLHLPHCEIHSGGGCDFLSVAHVTDDIIEFIHPLEITETHIIINITGFSAYGLTKDKAQVSPIQGLVLLFHQLFVPEERSILNVLLLPSNVVIREVQDERKRRNGDKETFIETNPHCNLTPNKPYILSTNITHGYRINPTTAEFLDFYQNYSLTFQLLETIVKEVELLLKEKEGDELVWNRLVWLPASPTDVTSTVSAVSLAAPPANPSTLPGRGFIRNHRMALKTRLGLLQPISLRLQDRGVLIDEEREEVVSKSSKTLQNQALLDMVVRKGARAQEHFYQVLKEVDPYLVEDLEEQTV
ncbi:caspase recruitment domain-containing protein 8-like [Coregonus clupeaformis]|uniref:caspase recruitment domain-containing protein 8-like n=1 Tax=Coregonus clupeaformis TaxID=59861 RepID=UPI001E1C4E45|nr:caspase recruitment domain-containing protein 8-like [Coregonus clupeaformis]